MKNINKFLIIGMMSILSLNAISAPLNSTMSHSEQIQHKIIQMKENGAIPKGIEFIFNKVSEETIKEDRLQAFANMQISEETCNININVTEDMKVGFSGSLENRELFKEITGAQTQREELLRTEYIVLHEASHCKLYEIKDVFKTGNSQVDELLNQFYKFSGTSYNSSEKGDASVYYTLHENFADTHAFMQMLREYGPTPEILKTIQQVQIERAENAEQKNPHGFVVHNTSVALKELLKEDNIDKLMNLKTQKEVEEFALELANKGLWQTINSYEAHSVISSESLVNGANSLLYSIIHKDMLPSDSNGNISVNLEGNKLYDVALQTYQQFKTTNDIPSVQTKHEFNKFIEEYSPVLIANLSKDIDNIIDEYFQKGVDVLASIQDQISLTEKITPSSIVEIKEQGIKDLASVANMSIKFDKNNTIQNILKIRTAAASDKINIKNNAP